jgi:hypothetical protein
MKAGQLSKRHDLCPWKLPREASSYTVRLRFSKHTPFIYSNIFENHTHSYISVENPDPIIYFRTM